MPVTLDTFLSDPQGSLLRAVVEHPDFGPALQSAFDCLNDPKNRQLMVRDTELYGVPPLAAVIHEIEARPAFIRAAAKHGRKGIGRLKQAIGVANKFAMAEEGFKPSLTASKLQDQRRLEDCLVKAPQYFSTARRYQRVKQAHRAGRRSR